MEAKVIAIVDEDGVNYPFIRGECDILVHVVDNPAAYLCDGEICYITGIDDETGTVTVKNVRDGRVIRDVDISRLEFYDLLDNLDDVFDED